MMNRNLSARANAIFVECARKNIAVTPLVLQKLLYFNYILLLQKNKNNLLPYLEFEAWEYGPVISDIYYYYKRNHNKPIQSKIKVNSSYPVLVDDNSVPECVKKYARLDPFELVRLTHKKGGAWWKAYKKNGENNLIKHQDIIAEFCNA